MVVETDLLEPSRHVLVCPGTSQIREDAPNRRYRVDPTEANGLREPTQFQIDKVNFVRREKCGAVIGRLDAEAMAGISARLFVVLGLAD